MEPEVQILASRVRKAVRKWVAPNRAVNPKKLSGACGIASYTLYKALQRKGYDPNLVCWSSPYGGHAWVELGEAVIDVTASQFGRRYPAVHIVPKWRYDVVDRDMGKTLYNGRAIRFIATWDSQDHTQYEAEIAAFIATI